METKKVLILVKTYPTISEKHDELVCTAGLLEDGSWIRLYPLPFRKLDYDTRYDKYQWIEVKVERNTSDFRPESHKVFDINSIKTLEKIGTENAWAERRRWVLKNQTVYTNLSELITLAKQNKLSLAVFKPTKILKFKVEETEREWPADKLQLLRARASQLSLFGSPEEQVKEFTVVQKIPYKFSYTIEDGQGTSSTMMIEDWEIGALYLNCLAKAKGDEKIAVQKVKEKYFGQFRRLDLYFFLGTTKEFHNVAPNPFIIIGAFYPPKIIQSELFD